MSGPIGITRCGNTWARTFEERFNGQLADFLVCVLTFFRCFDELIMSNLPRVLPDECYTGFTY